MMSEKGQAKKQHNNILIAILGFIVAYIAAGFVAGLVVLTASVAVGAALVLIKQRRGLHTKKADRGVFVYARSKRL